MSENLQKEGKRRVDNGGMVIKEGILAWKSGISKCLHCL
jgi:hypothetical protein